MTPAPKTPRRHRRAWFGYRARAMAALGVEMMIYDKPKLAGTLVGVVFAVVLSLQQLSILFGLLDKNTMFVDHAGADVWITPAGTEQLQPGAPLSDAVLMRARTTAGVAIAEPLVYSGAVIKTPMGASEPVTLVGTAAPMRLGGPWAMVAGARTSSRTSSMSPKAYGGPKGSRPQVKPPTLTSRPLSSRRLPRLSAPSLSRSASSKMTVSGCARTSGSPATIAHGPPRRIGAAVPTSVTGSEAPIGVLITAPE